MILRVCIRLALIVAVTAALAALRVHDDPEHVRPDKAFPPVSADLPGQQPDWLLAVADSRQAFFAEQARIEQERQEAERLAAEEAERVAAARHAPVQPVVSGGTSAPSSSPNCAGIPAWFPAAIAWRESNCTRGINTGNGYYGYAQVAGFHWFGGICDGLTWTIPAQEDECVDRLSAHGTRLGPWGG